MKKKSLAPIMALAACLCLAGCSTSVVEQTTSYFTRIGEKLAILAGDDTSDDSSSDEDSTKTALSAPESFTVDTDGSYSFSAVENADYYIVYMYDANSEDEEYLYISSNIEDDGSSSYSGTLTELGYAYGDYRVEVIAYPEVGDETYRKSDASSVEFVCSGEVADPEVSFLWDGFEGTFTIQLSNFSDYSASAYPDLLTVTLTNESDSSDVVTVTIEDMDPEDDTWYTSTTEVTEGTTYAVTASVEWDEVIVTNASFDLDLGSFTADADYNASYGVVGYLNSDIYDSMDFPMVADSLSTEAESSAGVWYSFTPLSVGHKGEITTASFGTSYYEYTATPTETTSGSAYSFTIVASSVSLVEESADANPWGATTTTTDYTGELELYEDGTFNLHLDYQYLGVNAWSGEISEFLGSDISGTWVMNDDGTIHLSYDHTSTVLGESEYDESMAETTETESETAVQ